MKVPKLTKAFAKFALCVLFGLSAPAALAQVKYDVDNPKFDDLQSPEVGGNTGKKKFAPKDWLEVEVKFNISDSGSKAKFVDRVNIRWYVAVKNPEGSGYWLLEKEVTHVNVPVGEDVYASVYLSPNGVKRLTNSDRASKSAIPYVGGEIEIGGVRKTFLEGTRKPFWQSSSSSLSRTDKVPLLNKNETPFKFLWYDRYAEIEERN